MNSYTLYAAWALVVLCLTPIVRRWSGAHFSSLLTRLIQTLESFHIFVRPESVRSGLILIISISVAAAFFLMRSVWVLPILVVGVGFLVLAVVRIRLQRHFKLIRQQLPSVIELLATSLRAGLSVRSALIQVSRQAPHPISKDLAILERMQRIGIDTPQAIYDWARRVPLEEISLFGFAVGVSTSSGGNLAQTLDRLAATFRQRLLLEEKVDALTAQGRLQAWIMVALPIALALVLTVIDYNAMSALWFTSAGHWVIAGVLVLELIGLVWIRRLIRIDI